MHIPPVSDALLSRYDRPGPRYTSYPPVPAWRDDFGHADLSAALGRAAMRPDDPLSLYVHVPFCTHLCAYCGCNVVVSRGFNRADPYLDDLDLEIDRVAEGLGERRTAHQIHWGGGTPTFLDVPRLERLWASLTRRFTLAPDAEVSIEINPVTTTLDQLKALRRLGFNRLSLGVQDLDPAVQTAIDRHQTEAQTIGALEAARGLGFESVNFDLIYGLPGQSTRSWARTLERVVQLAPDRLAIYSFAWVPQARPNQRRIDPAALPAGRAKVDLFRQAFGALTHAGYVPLGLDHFARADDALAVAATEGRLWRNFQGYTVHRATDTVAFGVTGISDVGGAYAQNTRTLPGYRAALQAERLPVVRGLRLSADDQARRALITELMCNLRIGLDDLRRQRFASALEALTPLAEDGLLTLHPDRLEVTPVGRLFLRNIAFAFDASHDEETTAGYSRTV